MPTASDRRIALLGTGIMGAHMARRLAQAGFAVTAWNRNADKAEKLAPFGVKTAASPSAACADADVVIVMLSDGPVVEQVLFSPDQTGKKPAEAMAPGSVLVVMSSIPVETCQAQAPRLAARGVHYIDAPVSGGEPGARDGTLAIMAGGDRNVVDGIADVFSAMGRVTHIGPVGTGQMTKLANQIIVGATMVGVAEALHFAARGGADVAAVRKALMGGFADSQDSQYPWRTHGRAEFHSGRTGGIPAQRSSDGEGARGCLWHAFHAAGLSGRDVRRHDRPVRPRP